MSVTTTDGDVAIGPSYHYVVEASAKTVPTVVQVGPTGGSAAGGNTVDIYGTGFTGATKVTFGGEAATSFKVLSDVQIAAVAPKLTKASCLAASHAVATLGLCQTQVQVTGPGGTSPRWRRRSPTRGSSTPTSWASISVPKKCGCEAYPTITEYDYVDGVHPVQAHRRERQAFVGDPSGSSLRRSSTAPASTSSRSTGSTSARASAAASEDPELLQLNAAGTEARGALLAGPEPRRRTATRCWCRSRPSAGSRTRKPFTYAPIPA